MSTPKPKPDRGSNLFVRLPSPMHRALKLLALEENRPLADLVRELLFGYMEKKAKEKGVDPTFLRPKEKS